MASVSPSSSNASSSSSSKQQVTVCRSSEVMVFNVNRPEAAGLQSDDAATAFEQEKPASIDIMLEEIERPPYVIVVHGPRKVGKSMLINSLVDHYIKKRPNSVDRRGHVTIISGKKRRIQLVECPNSINGMLDAAKYADAVILLIDAYVGFEMETFEFVNILRVHGMPKVMGVMTSLDLFLEDENLSREIKQLIKHFHTEICEEATLFCLSGPENGVYKESEMLALASFILDMEFHPLSWRAAQPYVLAEHLEDVTPPGTDTKRDRNIRVYGYLRGCDIKKGTKVHIAGVGDFFLFDIKSVNDPRSLRKRSLKDEEDHESEGFRLGTFLMLEVRGVPYQVVEYHNPHHPILIGGVDPGEEIDLGCIQATVKRHTWHRKLLKSRDPIIVSIGWRRYEASPIYVKEGCSGRLQMLNCTPVHRQCFAMFWGPLAFPNTRVVLVQNVPEDKAAFRVLATGVVLQFNQNAEIWWKCKQSGTPCRIDGRTALVKNLFKSDHEVNRFIDANVWTKSGVQGKVKQAAGEEDGSSEEGIAQCLFEDEIKMEDIVCRRVWQGIRPPPSFYLLRTAPETVDPTTYDEMREENRQGMPDLLHGPAAELKIKKVDGDGEDSDISSEDEKDVHFQRRPTFEQRRTVIFFDIEPGFKALILEKNFLKQYCNKNEQREFEKYPVRVISKEEEMVLKLEERERKKNCLENFKKSSYFLNRKKTFPRSQ